MKQIVVEGPDASGKSTLVKYLASVTGLPIITGDGPPRDYNELIEKARSQLNLEGIFDRSRIVSQRIYGMVRQDRPLDPLLVEIFYNLKPFIIYCRLNASSEHHQKDYDTPEHLFMIESSQEHISWLYDQWALRRANVIYRIGDDAGVIAAAVKEYFYG